MTIEITDDILSKTRLSKKEILLRIAIMLFAEEKLTLGQASKLAGLHQIQLQKELAKRKIPIHYDVEEFQQDLETISKMKI